jgi:hypothetical protein
MGKTCSNDEIISNPILQKIVPSGTLASQSLVQKMLPAMTPGRDVHGD